MSTPRYVWSDAEGSGRNVFVLFRQSFRLSQIPEKATLHLFADTRYRLRVNGEVAAYGPVRFNPTHPQHDSVNLAPMLKKGANCITVEVNHKGASSFDSRPSRGGFIAWGQIGAAGKKDSVQLGTPGKWKARRVDAWDAWAPPFSFAQGPIEILDRRALPESWFSPDTNDADWPEVVEAGNQQHWGALESRSIPMLAMDEILPERVMLAAKLDASETRFGVRIPADGTAANGQRQRACYAACLYSPTAQDVTIGAFWGPHYLNGEALKATKQALRGNREDFNAHLKEGWNLLYGEPETLSAGWGILLSIPAGKGIIASADENKDSPHSMQYVLPVDKEELEAARKSAPRTIAELPKLSKAWQRVPRGELPPLPARDIGWDVPVENLPVPSLQIANITLPASPAGSTISFDMGREFLGHVVMDVEAPEGTVIDVANGETPRPNGTVDIFKTNWFVNSADRFTARGGAERIEGFHPRGGRYLQISVRNASGPVKLNRVAIRNTLYPLDVVGKFESADPIFNWVHTAGLQTLQACMEDAYLDCPWRERGVYLGDLLAEFHVTRSVTADAALARRCLHLFAQDQHKDGLLPGMAPSWSNGGNSDYSLIWGMLLRDYWAATGDVETLRELYPHLQKLLGSERWIKAESGLVNTDSLGAFVDWSSTGDSKKGESASINAFLYHTMNCGAELATVLRKRDDATRLRKEAERLKDGFQTLWDAKRGAYAATRKDGKLIEEGDLHGNVLALSYGLATKETLPALTEYCARRVAANDKSQVGHIEPYFFHYALSGLYNHGRCAEAETAIRNNYGLMKEGGAWTIWEGMTNYGSACHAWSCGGMHYFAERTLGVRQIKPGSPDEIVIAPDSALSWAKGTVPHLRGPIDVSWRIEGGRLIVDATIPKGVRAKIQPVGRLAELTLQAKLSTH